MTLDSVTTRQNPAGSTRARLKSTFVTALLVSLAGTGLLGIAAILLGDFGELQGNVLYSALLVGLYSVLSLGCLSVLGRRHAPVGIAGIAASSVALVLGLGLVWTVGDLSFDSDAFEYTIRAFWFCAVLGFALAHASLLLNVGRDARGPARAMLTATLAAVGVVAVALALLAVKTDIGNADGFWRLVGVFAILDVVGTISVPLTVRFVGPRVAA